MEVNQTYMDAGFRKVLHIFSLKNIVFPSRIEPIIFKFKEIFFFFLQSIPFVELFPVSSQDTISDFLNISSHLQDPSLLLASMSSLTVLHLTFSPGTLSMISFCHQLIKQSGVSLLPSTRNQTLIYLGQGLSTSTLLTC